MDELLHSRVEQLKVIEERLDRIQKSLEIKSGPMLAVLALQLDVRDMVAAAEREHANF